MSVIETAHALLDPVEQYIPRVLDLIWMRLLEMPFCMRPPSPAFGSWERARGCTDCAATWLWHLSQHAVFPVPVVLSEGALWKHLLTSFAQLYTLIKKKIDARALDKLFGPLFGSLECWIADACTAVQILLFRSWFDCSLKRRCRFGTSVCGFILGQVYASTSGDEYPRDGAGYPGSKPGPVYPGTFYMQGVWISTTWTGSMDFCTTLFFQDDV